MNKYRASIATAVLGAATLSQAQSLSHSSFSSSMIASAMAKFHGVKASGKQLAVAADRTKSALPSEKVTPVIVAVVSAPAVSPAVTPVTLIASKPEVKAQATPSLESKKDSSKTLVASAVPIPAAKVERIPTAEEIQHIDREIRISGPMIDPSTIELEMPKTDEAVITPTAPQTAAKKLKIRWVSEGYFDAGYERLLGTFSTQILRYGIRYGQDDLHMYFKNQTLNTNGTGLPYPQSVTGTSVGLEARHWFPGDKIYASVSMGEGISGLDSRQADFRYGAAGYTSWANGRWFSDLYGELFYIALAGDTFLDARLRSGQKFHVDKTGYWWHYVVGQFWASGQIESPTENRAELGWGVGYVFQNAISINFELRGGYAYRSGVDQGNDRAYFNPTIILSGGFYKGFFNY